MAGSNVHRDTASQKPAIEMPLVDPRQGDVEDDASSTIQRSFLAIAGSLLAEISLSKLLFAWTLSIVLPAILLGLAPLVATAWVAKASGSFAELGYPGAVLILLLVAAVGWYGWRPLFRTAEANFWSLNALAVQPGYALCREALRHLAEKSLGERSTVAKLARLRAICSAGAGVVVCALAGLVAFLVWPATRWVGTVADVLSLQSLLVPTLANAVVVVSLYLAVAALAWGVADASMKQLRDVRSFELRAARRPHVADRPSFRSPRGRRALRLPDRKRAGRSAGQRSPEAGPGSPRGRAPGRATGSHPRHRRFDGCRPLDRVGRISRRCRAPSCSCRTDGRAAGKSRREHRRSYQSGQAQSAVQPRQAAPPDARAFGTRRRAGRSPARRRSPIRRTRADARRLRWPRTGRRLQRLPTRVRCGCPGHWGACGMISSR